MASTWTIGHLEAYSCANPPPPYLPSPFLPSFSASPHGWFVLLWVRFVNYTAIQETGGECPTRRSLHQPATEGISHDSFNERLAVHVRLVSHPKAKPAHSRPPL